MFSLIDRFILFQTQPQIAVQGQQVAQTAEGQTIVYQPVNADGTILQQGINSTYYRILHLFLEHYFKTVYILFAF